jgi:hypothetical protein
MIHHETHSITQRLQVLASNLERHMRDQGMSEFTLATASGVSARTVGNFLRPANRKTQRGTSKSFPSGTLANLFKLAEALDLDACDLLSNTDAARQRFYAAIEAAYAERRAAEG